MLKAIRKNRQKILIRMALLAVGTVFCAPILLLLTGSVMSRYELTQSLLPLLTDGEELISWTFFPDYPTFEHYFRILFQTPQFFVVFWNSMKIVCLILAGQFFVAVPAAWAFAVYPFRGRKWLFTLYIVLMLMPFQVTMLSNYLVLNRLELLNTHGAIILPAVFSAFPVFLIYRDFCSLPKGLIEAARIDGAGEWMIFGKIGLPLASGGILSAGVLGFLEYWSLIEQPMAFLEDQTLWPLSLYLPEIGPEQAGYSFVSAVITLIPAVFVFLAGREYLEQGITASAVKG
ncbi:MAG: carbohydrate ABC transporter permease [Lachnospiraceae bacterium]|nr:carbohydrate ABC transporter permease [Lachnospiraceae bacterium]